MKDFQATIRRLDEEIQGRKQKIAMHQVEIARLQDTRNVLMGIAESDIAHADAARAERVAAIGMEGAHAKPQLIVRKIGSGEEGAPSKTIHAHANGSMRSERLEKAAAQRLKKAAGKAAGSSKPGRRSKASASGQMRERIMAVMDPDTPMSSREIGDFLGLPRDEDARKAMSNALYQLKVKGALVRDAEHRYVRPQ